MEAEQRHSIQFDVFNLRRARRNSLFNIYEEINLNSNNLLEVKFFSNSDDQKNCEERK